MATEKGEKTKKLMKRGRGTKARDDKTIQTAS
jgi:hypothetical protein